MYKFYSYRTCFNNTICCCCVINQSDLRKKPRCRERLRQVQAVGDRVGGGTPPSFDFDPIPVAGEIRRDRGEGYCIRGDLEGGTRADLPGGEFLFHVFWLDQI